MKKKTLFALILGLLLGTIVYFSSSRAIIRPGTNYRIYHVEYQMRDITDKVDTGALCELLQTARMGRLPGGSPPYDAGAVQISLLEEPGGPIHIVLSRKADRREQCLVYTDGKSYDIRDGGELLDAVAALLPGNS